MKIWLLVIILAAPALAQEQSVEDDTTPEIFEGWEASAPDDPNEPNNWLDESHDYATSQAQALTEWMDSFFGVPNYEVEQPESLLRLDFTTDWDEEDGHNNNVRLRGKLQLPGLSERLNLVFSDDSGDDLDIDTNNNDDRNLDDGVGFLYEVSQNKRARLDLTLGLNWNRVRPGVRFRYQGTLGQYNSYRLTQRVQYENDEGFYATSQVELNRALSENSIVRWMNRGIYGEETDGVEWLSRLSLFQRTKTVNGRHALGINYFGAVNGVSDPNYVKNYRLGVLFRRQVYRNYLFLEVEPAYNYRKKKPEQKRQFAWSIALRLSIALERDLIRNNGVGHDSSATNTHTALPETETEEVGSDNHPAAASLSQGQTL